MQRVSDNEAIEDKRQANIYPLATALQFQNINVQYLRAIYGVVLELRFRHLLQMSS
jgi:hypothetical protein